MVLAIPSCVLEGVRLLHDETLWPGRLQVSEPLVAHDAMPWVLLLEARTAGLPSPREAGQVSLHQALLGVTLTRQACYRQVQVGPIQLALVVVQDTLPRACHEGLVVAENVAHLVGPMLGQELLRTWLYVCHGHDPGLHGHRLWEGVATSGRCE